MSIWSKSPCPRRFFFFHYKGYMLVFEIKRDTAMSVVVAKYLHWPVSIAYSEHIFSLAEHSADVEQLDVLKHGVVFIFFFKTLLLGSYRPWHRWQEMGCVDSWKWEPMALWGDIVSMNPKALGVSIKSLENTQWEKQLNKSQGKILSCKNCFSPLYDFIVKKSFSLSSCSQTAPAYDKTKIVLDREVGKGCVVK